jgi:hypothetical protein
LLIIYLKSGLSAAAALLPLAAVYLFWTGPDVISLPILFAAVGCGARRIRGVRVLRWHVQHRFGDR